jgi:hypothetical protein
MSRVSRTKNDRRGVYVLRSAPHARTVEEPTPFGTFAAKETTEVLLNALPVAPETSSLGFYPFVV